MTQYKAAFIDVDMTLTGPDRRISPANVSAVHDAIEAGVEVVVCTGRCWTEATPALAELQLPADALIICVGGAAIYRTGDGALVTARRMESDIRDATIDIVAGLGMPMLLLQDVSAAGYDYKLVRPAGDWPLYDHYRTMSAKNFGTTFREVPAWDDDPADGTLRISVVADGAAGDPVRDGLSALDGRAHWHDLFYPDTDLRLLEVFGSGVNKGTAMQWLCEQRGWPIEWTASIGDDINDLPMMQAGGLGVAMGNAHEKVRKAADHVTDGHDVDGAAKALRRILDGEFDDLARQRASAECEIS